MNNSMRKKTMSKSRLNSIIPLRLLFGMTKINRITFNFNLERWTPKGRNTQYSQETTNHEKLRMQSTLISRVKKEITTKNRREWDQEITVAKIEKAVKSFQNNMSSGNDGLPPEFYKTLREILRTDLHKLYIEISQLGEMPRIMQ